jgi:hypothetical protein
MLPVPQAKSAITSSVSTCIASKTGAVSASGGSSVW